VKPALPSPPANYYSLSRYIFSTPFLIETVDPQQH
jgi:hypothetical protein